jgi:hypothetical protein
MKTLSDADWAAIEAHPKEVSEALGTLMNRASGRELDVEPLMMLLESRGYAQWLVDFGLSEELCDVENELVELLRRPIPEAVLATLESLREVLNDALLLRAESLSAQLSGDGGLLFVLKERFGFGAVCSQWESLGSLPSRLVNKVEAIDKALMEFLVKNNIDRSVLEGLRVEWGIATDHKGFAEFLSRGLVALGGSAAEHPLSYSALCFEPGPLMQSVEADEIATLDALQESLDPPRFVSTVQPVLSTHEPILSGLQDLFEGVQDAIGTLFSELSAKPLLASGEGEAGFVELYELGYQSHIALAKHDDEVMLQAAIAEPRRLFAEPRLLLSTDEALPCEKRAEGIFWFALGSTQSAKELRAVVELPIDGSFQYFKIPKPAGENS